MFVQPTARFLRQVSSKLCREGFSLNNGMVYIDSWNRHDLDPQCSKAPPKANQAQNHLACAKSGAVPMNDNQAIVRYNNTLYDIDLVNNLTNINITLKDMRAHRDVIMSL